VAEYSIRYGSDTLAVKLPAGLSIAEVVGRPMPPLPSVRKRLREGLADPFGCAPLSVQVRDKQSAMVVVADYTRNNAYDKWLPELLYQLNDCGIPDSAIQLYIGSGTHRPMSEDEKRACYTDEVWKRVEILDHDCDAPTG